jgi:multidrug resistance efflux pump
MQTINATGDFTKLTQYVSLRVSLDETPSNDISSRFPVLPGMSVEVWVKGD